MAEHTPGPWTEWLDEDTNSFSIYTDPHKRGYGEWIAEVHGTRGSFKANAHLIAAAPDLLAVLERLVAAVAEQRTAEDRYLRSGQDAEDWPALEDATATVIIRENEARAAIAKARGE